jgi:hypothetical protein
MKKHGGRNCKYSSAASSGLTKTLARPREPVQDADEEEQDADETDVEEAETEQTLTIQTLCQGDYKTLCSPC